MQPTDKPERRRIIVTRQSSLPYGGKNYCRGEVITASVPHAKLLVNAGECRYEDDPMPGPVTPKINTSLIPMQNGSNRANGNMDSRQRRDMRADGKGAAKIVVKDDRQRHTTTQREEELIAESHERKEKAALAAHSTEDEK